MSSKITNFRHTLYYGTDALALVLITFVFAFYAISVKTILLSDCQGQF